jgi:hypothetical protein
MALTCSLHFGFTCKTDRTHILLAGFYGWQFTHGNPYGGYDRDLSRPAAIAACAPVIWRISGVLEDV